MLMLVYRILHMSRQIFHPKQTFDRLLLLKDTEQNIFTSAPYNYES